MTRSARSNSEDDFWTEDTMYGYGPVNEGRAREKSLDKKFKELEKRVSLLETLADNLAKRDFYGEM